MQTESRPFSVGRALQLLATECFRACVHDDFWLWCAQATVCGCGERALIIFADVRFPNEANWIIDRPRGGSVLRITRDPAMVAGATAVADGRRADHVSETALAGHEDLIHDTITNHGTLEDFRLACEAYADRAVVPLLLPGLSPALRERL
jgi:hypothetical protein